MHETNIVDRPTQDCKTINAATECKPLIFFRINTCVFENIRMNHPRTHHFYPSIAQFLRSVRTRETHIDFYSRLNKRKKTRTKSHFDRAFK